MCAGNMCVRTRDGVVSSWESECERESEWEREKGKENNDDEVMYTRRKRRPYLISLSLALSRSLYTLVFFHSPAARVVQYYYCCCSSWLLMDSKRLLLSSLRKLCSSFFRVHRHTHIYRLQRAVQQAVAAFSCTLSLSRMRFAAKYIIVVAVSFALTLTCTRGAREKNKWLQRFGDGARNL